MGEIGPMTALARKARCRASPMEKPIEGRLVVHPEKKQKNHFGLPPAERTVWPLVARVRPVCGVVCERKRAEEALFLQRERNPRRVGGADLTSNWGG